MSIKITEYITEASDTNDWTERYEITIHEDGKKIAGFYVGHIEPEDATLGRDLSFAYDALKFFKLGYEAGKSGKEVEYIVGITLDKPGA